ncbi:MAG: hypothetical protein LCH37_12875 [Bacteroidetes bacterium]|nr:hypothetical protein [Bacteroidota bacterium]
MDYAAPLSEAKLIGIEQLKSAMHLPTNRNSPLENFSFAVNFENRIEAERKRVYVIVHIHLSQDGHPEILSEFSASCIFQLPSIEPAATGEVQVAPHLLDILNRISLSTTRGLLFSTLKGTYLHEAILPLIEPLELR